MEEPRTVPTLYEWMGGMPAISKLLETFYARVPSDPTLAPVFAQMAPEPALQHKILVDNPARLYGF